MLQWLLPRRGLATNSLYRAGRRRHRNWSDCSNQRLLRPNAVLYQAEANTPNRTEPMRREERFGKLLVITLDRSHNSSKDSR